MNVNPVFIPHGDEDGKKTLCTVCKVNHVYIPTRGIICPSCGSRPNSAEIVKAGDDIVLVADTTEPMIVSKKSASVEKKRDPDLPAGARWVEKD